MASLKTSDFDYELPKELIAQEPAEPRDHSRMLVLDKSTGDTQHRFFYELPDYLRKGDLLVLNDSRVIPARLLGYKEGTGAKAEIMLLRSLGEGKWEALARPARRLKKESVVRVSREKEEGTRDGPPEQILMEVLEEREGGIRLVKVHGEELIDKLGRMPLPPYIHRTLSNPERYQTIYSRVRGSVAAPTAGLHFTTELMANLRGKGINQAFITLHVGLDSFRIIKEEDPQEHSLHKEYAIIGEDTAAAINQSRQNGGRIICVGTTVVRALEQAALSFSQNGANQQDRCFLKSPQAEITLKPFSGWCDILILPGYRFQFMNTLITNFHPSRSTQLMLVSAFAGRAKVLAAYEEAIERRYRFFSLGDAMLVL